jgi:hypothetical protein
MLEYYTLFLHCTHFYSNSQYIGTYEIIDNLTYPPFLAGFITKPVVDFATLAWNIFWYFHNFNLLGTYLNIINDIVYDVKNTTVYSPIFLIILLYNI